MAFAFRRLDGASSDFRTSGDGDQSATIRALLGSRITRELMRVDVEDQRELHFIARACFTAPLPSHSSVAIQSKQVVVQIVNCSIPLIILLVGE